MRRTRVKICGVMRPEDAAMAAACGADAVGLIFHSPSARSVSIEMARQILRAIPTMVTPIGLFVDATVETIMSVTSQLGLRDVQLHGDEPPQMLASLNGLTVAKAVCASRETLAHSLDFFRGVPNLKGIVLETSGTEAPGGTGVLNDWDLIFASQKSGLFDGLPPIIAAGGLTPENVGDVVRSLRPWAVDVSSGVERIRGQKSEALVRAFIEAVQRADSSTQGGPR